MLRGYHRAWLTSDLVAGLVLTTLLVPQGMAYAELAGLPPVTGLYTTVACLVAYAVFGPSRILVLGPDSAVSPLIFAAITPLVAVGSDPGTAIALAGMLALFVGAIEIGLGAARLGFVADLLSKEVKVGYMNGLAVVIVVGQLPEAVRLLDRCQRLHRRGQGLRDASGRAGLGSPRGRARLPRAADRAAAVRPRACRPSWS